MPIKGLSEARRVPRLGIIRLGVKVKTDKGTEYPKAVDYFVLPPEHSELAILGEKPTCLPIMFPVEDETSFAQQFYRNYSMSRGLVCKGDGERCGRMVDKSTGAIADRNSKDFELRETDCTGRNCPDYQEKRCKEVMNLQFLMPTIPGLGIWQVNTGSVNSIINVNSAIEFIRKMYGRISFIPLVLAMEKQTVVTPEDGTENGGKKKTVHVLTLNTKGTMQELMASASKTTTYLLPAPATTEPPEDMDEDGALPGDTPLKPLSRESEKPKEIIVEKQKQVDKDIKILWGDKKQEEDKKSESPAYAKATGKPALPVQERPAGEAIAEKKPVEAPAPKAPPKAVKEKQKIDPASIKTIGDFLDAVLKNFNVFPDAAVRELGLKSRMEITDPQEAYQKIASVREGK